MRRNTAILVVGVALALGLSIPTSGVSSIDADRGVGVDVASDQHAYVAVTDDDVTVTGDTTDVVLVDVTNQATERLNLSVSVRDDGGSTAPYVETVTVTDWLDPGDSGVIEGDVVCDGHTESVTVELELTATGSTTNATLTRTVTIDCQEATTTSSTATASSTTAETATATQTATAGTSESA
jgi:hypothetical protein